MRRIQLKSRIAEACAVALLAGAATARADEPPVPPAESARIADLGGSKAELKFQAADEADEWRFDFNSWMWLVGMTGDVGARGRSAHVNASFSDILDASDSLFAFSGRLEVGKGSWGGFIDGMYAVIGADDQTGPGGVADVDVTSTMIIIDFGAMYRLGDWEPTGDAAKNRRHIAVDLYAGGRYTDLELELAPANLSSVSRSVSWVDPIVGAKLVLPISESWHIRTNGDIGGFGVGSDFCWSATGVFGYDFMLFDLPATIFGGYRAIGYDYTDDGPNQFVWDIVAHGPILGFSLKF